MVVFFGGCQPILGYKFAKHILVLKQVVIVSLAYIR